MKKERIKDKEQLGILVDNILLSKGDAEIAHSEEDALHLRIIEQFCPKWIKEEIRRLNDANFPRWYS